MTLRLIVNTSSAGGRLMAGFSIAEGDGFRPEVLVTSDYGSVDVPDEAFWARPRAMAAAPELLSGLEVAIKEIERLSALSGETNNATLAKLKNVRDNASGFPLECLDNHDKRTFAALLHGHVVWSKVGEHIWHTNARADNAVGIIIGRDGKFYGSTKLGFSEPCDPMKKEMEYDTLEDAKLAVGTAMGIRPKPAKPQTASV